MFYHHNKAAIIGLIFAGAVGLSTPTAASDEWEWMLTPYMWASDTSANLTVNDTEIDAELKFEDLIEKVDLGGQLHFEGNRGLFGFFVDATYLKVEESESVQPKLPLEDKLRIDTEVEMLLAEAAGTYHIAGDSKLEGVDLFLGARVIEMDLDLGISLPGPLDNELSVSSKETLVDGFVGARYATSFGSNWTFALRGDVGAGDTDLAWNVIANLLYRFGENDRYAAVLAYRYLQIEYEASSGGQDIDAEFTMYGPALGFAYRF